MSDRYEPTAPWNDEFMEIMADIAYSLRILSGRE